MVGGGEGCEGGDLRERWWLLLGVIPGCDGELCGGAD